MKSDQLLVVSWMISLSARRMIRYFNLISLLGISSLLISSSLQPLTIYLHVGPHKTGTSHIQHYLELNRQLLSDEKICFPKVVIGHSVLESRGKAQNRIAEDIVQLKNFSNAVWEPLQDCVSQSMNILISAENLCTLTKNEIQLLKTHLLTLHKNIQFKIIIYYREWFSRLHSTFAEVYRKNDLKIISYSDFLFVSLDKFMDSPQLDTSLLVKGYSEIFGQQNMIIVDYDGVNAAQKDIAFVFICEILKILCSKTSRLNIVAAHENEKPNILIVQFIYLLKFYIHTQKLQFCSFDLHIIHELIRFYRDRDFMSKFPLNKPNLQYLRNHSLIQDQQFRKEFLGLIRYNNQSASNEIRNNFQIEEINMYAFYESNSMMKILAFEFDRMKKSGKLCNWDGSPYVRSPATPLIPPPVLAAPSTTTTKLSKDKSSSSSSKTGKTTKTTKSTTNKIEEGGRSKSRVRSGQSPVLNLDLLKE